jgi:iron(III) transport system permease protein
LLALVFSLPMLRSLYGSMLLLIVAIVVSSMTLGVQLIRSNLMQLGVELEEAVRVGGGTWWDIYRYITIPLLAPVLLLVGAMTFVAAARNVSAVALLSTSASRPLALLQLDYMKEGRYEPAAVVGVIVALMTGGIALAGRLVSRRVGMDR